MSIEYQPLVTIKESREKLKQIADTAVEVAPEILHECILDVIASRGGKRWRILDEVHLSTRAGMHLIVAYDEKTIGELAGTWMDVRQGDDTLKVYKVCILDDGPYELREVNPDAEEEAPVSNWGNLAPARLLGILADAHLHTPVKSPKGSG